MLIKKKLKGTNITITENLTKEGITFLILQKCGVKRNPLDCEWERCHAINREGFILTISMHDFHSEDGSSTNDDQQGRPK